MNPEEANYTQTEDNEFWSKATEPSLNLIWDNHEDEIFAELLEADGSPRTQ